MFHFSIAFVFYILISSLEKLSQAQKQPQLQDFLTKMKTKANIVPNLNHKTRKIRKKTQQAQTRIQQDFICKKETKQGYNKKMHLKLVLNKLKVMGNSNSIYTHWEPISKKFFKFFLIYMWPMFTHVHSCVNYE
jgi:phenylalanyl-tRNA synthetase alpha subunit